jgi:hypothetical protein
VPVGHLPEHDLPRAGAIQLAATVALADLGLLVLGDHAPHLHQELGLRVLAVRGPLEEAHADPEALKLLEDQHLVGERPRQAIGA